MHPVERDVPERQPVEDGGRLVAHDRGPVETGHRRPDQQAVPGRRIRGEQRVDVCPPAQPAQLPGTDQSAEFVVRPAGDDRVAAEEEGVLGASRASAMRRRCVVTRGPRGTVDSRNACGRALSGCC